MQELSRENLVGILHKCKTKGNKRKEDEGLLICAFAYNWSSEKNQMYYI